MGLFLDILGGLAKGMLEGDPLAREKQEHRDYVAKQKINVAKQKINMALPCRRCKRLAEPIEGTKNRYRCKCGNQFAAARHHL